MKVDPILHATAARSSETTVVITTLAEYQTVFWAPVAAALKEGGVDVLVCAFDDRSVEMLKDAGVPTERVLDATGPDDETAFSARLQKYGISNGILFSHERVTFRIRDEAVLRRKFMRASNAMEQLFDRLVASGRKPVLIQELGGFLSVIASFFAARTRGIDNWFAEPSFFRGRMFFLRNTFDACNISGPIAAEVSPAVSRYLDETLAQRAIVIPKKDHHHYSTVLRKITNRRNIRRLFEKMYDKHVLGKRQEFSYVGVHVSSHLRMGWNSLRMRKIYTPLDRAGRFVYYPLHVPFDVALTVRSPEFFDQLSLVEYLLRIVPHTHSVAIKEHPAQVGAMPSERIAALVRRYDNLVVLPPATNNYAVLEKASAVVSVNSKSGAEALLVGRNVLVLGDAFYGRSEFVKFVGSLRDLSPALAAVLDRPGPDQTRVRRYFQNVWDRSFAGELYVPEPGNVAVVVRSLQEAALRHYDSAPLVAAPQP